MLLQMISYYFFLNVIIFIFCEKQAKSLSELFGMEINENQVVLGHTPFKTIVKGNVQC